MKLTTEEFRKHAEYVAHMRQLFEEDPIFQMALDAMEESENPMNKVAPPDITPHGAYIMLGEQTGYRQFKTRFMLLGQTIEVLQPDGEPTYANPTDNEDNPNAATS